MTFDEQDSLIESLNAAYDKAVFFTSNEVRSTLVIVWVWPFFFNFRYAEV